MALLRRRSQIVDPTCELAVVCTGGPDDGTAALEPVSASVADTFGRPDANEPGATDTGQLWSVVSAEWGIREGRAVVLGPEDPSPKLAVVNTKSAEGRVEVKLSDVETVLINGSAVAELVGLASDDTQAGLVASGLEANAPYSANFQAFE